MTTPVRMSHDTHSTTQNSTWSTRRIATTALLCALSLVATFIEIPIFPPAAWLTYDPSGIVALVSALCFGMPTGVIVIVLTWVVRTLLTFNIWGNLMAIVANVSLVVPMMVVRGTSRTQSRLLVSMVVGGIICLVVTVLANLVVTPLYTAVSVADVAAMIMPFLVPFNLIKIAINCVVCALVAKPVDKALAAWA